MDLNPLSPPKKSNMTYSGKEKAGQGNHPDWLFSDV